MKKKSPQTIRGDFFRLKSPLNKLLINLLFFINNWIITCCNFSVENCFGSPKIACYLNLNADL